MKKLKCPIQYCTFVFLSSHYTDREPHLRDEHNKIQLAREIQLLLVRHEWTDTMAREIIESCETLKIRSK